MGERGRTCTGEYLRLFYMLVDSDWVISPSAPQFLHPQNGDCLCVCLLYQLPLCLTHLGLGFFMSQQWQWDLPYHWVVGLTFTSSFGHRCTLRCPASTCATQILICDAIFFYIYPRYKMDTMPTVPRAGGCSSVVESFLGSILSEEKNSSFLPMTFKCCNRAQKSPATS